MIVQNTMYNECFVIHTAHTHIAMIKGKKCLCATHDIKQAVMI